MTVFSDRTPAWITQIAPENFNDNDLFRIVTFFVFHSPCPNLSYMGRTLQDYGWHTPWRQPYYLNRQLKGTANNHDLIFSAKDYDSMDNALAKSNMLENFPTELKRERVCIYDNQRNQFMSVFYHLRNAFAHCRLNMVDVNGECVFILEDVQYKQNFNQFKVSARMILRKSTLLNWINLIEDGEREDPEYRG